MLTQLHPLGQRALRILLLLSTRLPPACKLSTQILCMLSTTSPMKSCSISYSRRASRSQIWNSAWSNFTDASPGSWHYKLALHFNKQLQGWPLWMPSCSMTLFLFFWAVLLSRDRFCIMINCVLFIVSSFSLSFGLSSFPTVHDRPVVLMYCPDNIYTLRLHYFLTPWSTNRLELWSRRVGFLLWWPCRCYMTCMYITYFSR